MGAPPRPCVGPASAHVPLLGGVDHRGGTRSRGGRGGHGRLARHRQPPHGGGAVNHLLRELAPVSGEAWAAIDEEASRTLRHFLTARKVVDFSGPHGWKHSAETLGRVEPIGAPPAAGVDATIRRVQPLAEFRTPFEMSRSELETIDRGSLDYDVQ